jgi:hypothetical protein
MRNKVADEDDQIPKEITPKDLTRGVERSEVTEQGSRRAKKLGSVYQTDPRLPRPLDVLTGIRRIYLKDMEDVPQVSLEPVELGDRHNQTVF